MVIASCNTSETLLKQFPNNSKIFIEENLLDILSLLIQCHKKVPLAIISISNCLTLIFKRSFDVITHFDNAGVSQAILIILASEYDPDSYINVCTAVLHLAAQLCKFDHNIMDILMEAEFGMNIIKFIKLHNEKAGT